MSDYRFVTKEDIAQLRDKWYGSLYEDVWSVLERLLAEREAYREIALNLELFRFNGVKLEVDAEAAKVLSKTGEGI